MEVHAHAHTARKKWHHYFWEFLMLFLAVFCGFLAEYQLEHKIEKDREKQFIRSMISDLQDDIQNLDALMSSEQARRRELDTLIGLLNDPILAKENGDALYYTARIGPRSNPFGNNNRTFDQLRNSGGFRLIHKAAASNRIMDYYNRFILLRLLEDNYNHEFDNYKKVAGKIIDPAILRNQEDADGQIIRSNNNPALLTYDKGMLKELAFHAVQMNGSRRGKLQMLGALKQNAEELKKFLTESYHIK